MDFGVCPTGWPHFYFRRALLSGCQTAWKLETFLFWDIRSFLCGGSPTHTTPDPGALKVCLNNVPNNLFVKKKIKSLFWCTLMLSGRHKHGITVHPFPLHHILVFIVCNKRWSSLHAQLRSKRQRTLALPRTQIRQSCEVTDLIPKWSHLSHWPQLWQGKYLHVHD